MIKKTIITWCVLIIPVLLFGQTEQRFTVNYVSAENIYLNAGSADGLSVGDRLVIKRGDELIAGLEVVYVAERSASCKIVNLKDRIQRGDVAILVKKKTAIKKSAPKSKSRERVFTDKRQRREKRHPFARITGSASLQLYSIDDMKATGLNFNQRTIRLNLRVRNMWGKGYHFRIRTRSRYNERVRSYNSFVPQTEWRNRIYTAAFSYDDSEALFNFKVGRIISNKFSGIGYIDGMMLQGNLSERVKIGVFGGSQPEWRYSDFQPSLKKYGAYFNYMRGDYSRSRFESTIAAAGEYHDSMVSREFIYFQNSYYGNKKWSLFQSAEIDINRDWRKSRTNENVSLTNLYISANFNFTEWISATLSYDNRRNYLTYETRSIADSLFDDAFRHGVRAYVNVRLFKDYFIYTNFGVRKRETDADYTYSYAGGMNKRNFLMKRMFLSFSFSGFSNYFASGFSPSLRWGKSFARGHYVNITYGNYFYALNSSSENRLNQWLRLESVIELVFNFYLSAQYGYHWGDDSTDQRVLAEIGYRF